MSTTQTVRSLAPTFVEVPPRIHAAGIGALLLDAATAGFDADTQKRILALAGALGRSRIVAGVRETIPGVNNLMLLFDPLVLHPDQARKHLLALWGALDAEDIVGREIEIPVVYGGGPENDLLALAEGVGLGVEEFVRLHSEATYSVACIGSMAGFSYLTGLPAELSTPRRSVPRMKVAAGSVIIGGVQAGVMPCTAPSGWHILGMADVRMFDPTREPACLLSLGDHVRFRVQGIEA